MLQQFVRLMFGYLFSDDFAKETIKGFFVRATIKPENWKPRLRNS